MSLSFVGPGGSFETPWIRYAILRDNVLHHLDSQSPTLRFVSLYSVAAALGGSRVTVNARQLGSEVEQVVRELGPIPANQLAISARTQAVLRFDPMLPVSGPTELLPASISLPWLDTSAETIGEVFRSLLANLQRITEGASELDQIEVFDV